MLLAGFVLFMVAPLSVYGDDCNNNGLDDLDDIANMTSADCQPNDIPDECEADTDADGVIDDCDNCALFNPTQDDFDFDGIGDVCEAAQAFYAVSLDDDILRLYQFADFRILAARSMRLSGRTILGATGLAVHPTTGVMYALLYLNGQNEYELVTVDPTTAVATSVGNTGFDNLDDLAFDDNGTLYGITFDTGGSDGGFLVTMDTSTGAAAIVAALSGPDESYQSLAFNPLDGLLYHVWDCVEDGASNVESVDPLNGFATAAITTTGVFGSVCTPRTLAFIPGNNLAMEFDDFPIRLYLRADGPFMLDGFFPPQTIDGVAFSSATPPSPPPCPPGAHLYAAAFDYGDFGASLWAIDTNDGASTFISYLGVDYISGMDLGSDGLLHGIAAQINPPFDLALVTIDPCTGTTTQDAVLSSAAPLTGNLGDLAIRESDDAMYWLDVETPPIFGPGSLQFFFSVDVNTGVVTEINDFNSLFGGGLAFAPNGDLVYAGLTDFGGVLGTIDPMTGALTPTTLINLGFPSPFSLTLVVSTDFLPTSNVLYSAIITANFSGPSQRCQLATIDTVTGGLTYLGSTVQVTAMAFYRGPANLVVTKTASAGVVAQGQNVAFTITVTNNGPDDAQDVVLTDVLPAGFDFVSTSSGCAENSGTVECNLGTLANGASESFEIVVTAAQLGAVTNTAAVTTSSPDGDPADNSASAVVVVLADADNDGTPDAYDPCPAGGDSDGDGVEDCQDDCPNDANKLDPGVCGCGVSDTDSDGDGVPNCYDKCPNDSNKTDPGFCGCGTADADSNGNNVPDCLDSFADGGPATATVPETDTHVVDRDELRAFINFLCGVGSGNAMAFTVAGLMGMMLMQRRRRA